jgi:2',3'-cyclic-nucleotide 2'-phosphodiesterase (5'-nucleotidase family)
MKDSSTNTKQRRDFLKNLGLLGMGATVIPSLSADASSIDSNEFLNTDAVEMDTEKTIQILQTTDVHCQVYPHDELFWENEQLTFRKAGGYAHLATYFKNAKKKNPNTFILDTGDMFQGSELAVKTTGKALVPILNSLGYQLYLPGNWEVVYYKKAMQTLMGALNAPKVCANMYHDLGEGKKGELIFNPYYIWNVEGVKIGFLGYTDPLVPLRQSPNYSKGIIYTKPEENIKHYVDVLKNDEQCAFIIILSHLGLSQQIALANDVVCEGVDYIFGGDTHERVRKPIQCKYAKVVEPGAFGSFVGKLELKIKGGKVIADSYVLDEVEPNKLKADAAVTKLIQANEEPFSKDINEIVGYSTLPLYRNFVVENTIDTMILNALNWQLPRIDIVLSNGFRFCPPRNTPDQTGNIPITNGFIFDMLPVDSTVRTGKVTGKQIFDWLEKELNNVFAKDASKRFGGWVIKFKGMSIEFKAFEPMGSRVQKVLVKGLPLDLNATYTICACERDGDPADMLCRMKNVQDAKNTTHTLHQVMKDYLKNNSPVTPSLPLSAKIMDAPQTLLSQVYGVDYQFK